MSMIYFNGTSKQMNAFLEKGRNTKTFRAMDDGEVFILDDIRRTLKAMNLLITECIATGLLILCVVRGISLLRLSCHSCQ